MNKTINRNRTQVHSSTVSSVKPAPVASNTLPLTALTALLLTLGALGAQTASKPTSDPLTKGLSGGPSIDMLPPYIIPEPNYILDPTATDWEPDFSSPPEIIMLGDWVDSNLTKGMGSTPVVDNVSPFEKAGVKPTEGYIVFPTVIEQDPEFPKLKRIKSQIGDSFTYLFIGHKEGYEILEYLYLELTKRPDFNSFNSIKESLYEFFLDDNHFERPTRYTKDAKPELLEQHAEELAWYLYKLGQVKHENLLG